MPELVGDPVLLLVAGLLIVAGLGAVYAATRDSLTLTGASGTRYVARDAINVGVALAVGLFVAMFGHRRLLRLAPALYLQSIGRQKQAEQMYRLFEVEARLFIANGVTLDTDPTLFYADHGSPAQAVAAGVVGIRIRPFIKMDDAYAWALLKAGRDTEALGFEHKATALGTHNALFYFHTAMIELALGDRAQARADLSTTFAINRYFSPLHEPEARAALARLGAAR